MRDAHDLGFWYCDCDDCKKELDRVCKSIEAWDKFKASLTKGASEK